jgi:hypothetical protein
MKTYSPNETALVWHIRDARNRRVKPLDPVAVQLLRRHDIIDADTLASIAGDSRLRIKAGERVALAFGLLAAFLVIGLFSTAVYTQDLAGAPIAKTVSLFWMCSIPWIIWFTIKKRRIGQIKSVMLQHGRCPLCGYDLRMLPTDPDDGATICPECGCAWPLGDAGIAKDRSDD